jgi:glycosyltransferase involved in cell wall biosynthesis
MSWYFLLSLIKFQDYGFRMDFRKISVITPSLNRAHFLEPAIQSVVAQNYPNYEHIIMDGGSTDGTEKVIQKYLGIKFVSDPDRGMYDALNKGLDIARGDIIGFLNTDDLYAENIFRVAAANFDDVDVMAVAGRAIVFSELPDGRMEIVDKYSPEAMNLMECSTIGSNFFNAWFFRRSAFDRIGKFNTNYRIAGDRDFMLRFALNDLKYTVINDLVYKYRKHEDSLTFDRNDQKRERSADEQLAMTGLYLGDPDLSKLARRLLIQRRTLETLDMASRSLWMWNYGKFIHYSIEGSRYDHAWPLKFFQHVIKKGVKMIWTKRSGITFQ